MISVGDNFYEDGVAGVEDDGIAGWDLDGGTVAGEGALGVFVLFKKVKGFCLSRRFKQINEDYLGRLRVHS